MTLNITLLTEDVAYQSADFRLTDVESELPIDDPSDKTVRYHHMNTQTDALITYTGIGSFIGRSTADYVAEWLTGQELNFDQVCELLATRGARWLRRVTRAIRKPVPPHTFIVCGFDNAAAAGATAAVISNFEAVSGLRKHGPLSPDLITTTTTWAGSPVVLITGCLSDKPASSREQRRSLVAAARDHGSDAGRISIEIAKRNRAASRSDGTDMISEDCAVAWVDRWGQGARNGAPHGTNPRVIVEGVDLHALLGGLLAPGGHIVASSFSSTRAIGAPNPPCTPTLSKAGDFERFDIRAIEPDYVVHPSAVSSAGATAGVLRESSDPSIPWSVYYDGEATADFGVETGIDAALNAFAGDSVVGHFSLVDGDNWWAYAIKWHPTGGLINLDAGGAKHSGATVASGDHIAGWVSFDDTAGQDKQHAARWTQAGSVQVVQGLPTESSSSTAINAEGDVLVVGYNGFVVRPSHWLWRAGVPRADRIEARSDTIFPVGIDDTGRIVGIDKSTEPNRAMVLEVGAPDWTDLPVPDDYELTRIGGDGTIAGRVKIGEWYRPWVLPNSSAGGPILLPTYANHHGYVSGVQWPYLVGFCTCTSHGDHGILWTAKGALG